MLININLFEGDWAKTLKVFPKTSIALISEVQTVEAVSQMVKDQRKPTKNTAFSVHFVIKGAEKRRTLAYAKAKMLQSELGVTPHLVSVK